MIISCDRLRFAAVNRVIKIMFQKTEIPTSEQSKDIIESRCTREHLGNMIPMQNIFSKLK